MARRNHGDTYASFSLRRRGPASPASYATCSRAAALYTCPSSSPPRGGDNCALEPAVASCPGARQNPRRSSPSARCSSPIPFVDSGRPPQCRPHGLSHASVLAAGDGVWFAVPPRLARSPDARRREQAPQALAHRARPPPHATATRDRLLARHGPARSARARTAPLLPCLPLPAWLLMFQSAAFRRLVGWGLLVFQRRRTQVSRSCILPARTPPCRLSSTVRDRDTDIRCSGDLA